jgi:amyloid beta precursor protein binding protein 1
MPLVKCKLFRALSERRTHAQLSARAPGTEIPTTAALMGGMVAQEVIKKVTKQYVLIDGVCAIDLVSSTTGTIKV